MRIVRWAEFRTLPRGTIFQEYHPHHLGELMILGDAGNMDDYVASSLMPQAVMGDYFPFPTDDFVIATPVGFGRDGVFDHDKRRWLVWGDSDRTRLAGWLLNPDIAASQQNDDRPHAIIGVFE